MSTKIELQVHLDRDEETGRWYVSESDIPGLELEAENAAALLQKVEAIAPEMIDLNLREIIERHRPELLDAPAPHRAAGPAMSYRPIFDRPFEACPA